MDKHDKDYFVPNFGVDHDVITTQNNLKNAEKSLNHNWNLSLAQANHTSIPACNSYTFPNCVKEAETAAPQKLQADMDKHDKDYFVPNFGADQEMESDKANIAQVEKKLGHVFTPTEAGDGHKMNYYVPNFGADPDIAGT